jgi:hypothetical protein
MLRSTCIEAEFEAASGDVDDAGEEPVYIARRATGQDVIIVRLRSVGRELRGTYTILDPSLNRDDVVVLFAQTYLGTLTNHCWRATIDDVVLEPADGATLGARFPYPRA